MRFFVFSLLVVVSVSAGNVPFSHQGALLVLPPSQENSTSTTTQSPKNVTFQSDKENLESVNERIMERLRQEVGSERGVYHVYLPDGRLQRVQYTTAQVSGQDEQKQYQVPQSENQQVYPTQNEQVPKGIYYVQVPEERVQALREYQASNYQQYSPSSQNPEFAQYNQQPAQYYPVKVVSAEEMSQYRSAQSAGQKQYYSNENQAVYNQDQAAFSQYQGASNQNQGASNQYRVPSSQYQSESNQNQAASSANQAAFSKNQAATKENPFSAKQQEVSSSNSPSFLASVKYSEVEPITGPVYSFSPDQYVRILRHARD